MNPTGGLIYHLRALRYRDSLWSPFRQQLSHALDSWNPREEELIVFGPSGGHTLPVDFLQRFTRLWFFEPDRLAPVFFRRNHPDLHPVWSRRDLIFDRGRYDPSKLIDLLATKKAAVLFSNLLGQLQLLNRDSEAMTKWWQDLQPHLEGRSWLSYHDVFSFDGSAQLPTRMPSGPVIPQLLQWAVDRKLSLELIDHGTSELFSETQVHLLWQLTPRRTQVIGVSSARSH